MKAVIDVLMTAALLLVMPYSLVGEAAHEWIGVAMFALFILHHVLNRKWSRGLFKGRYTPFRVFQTALVLAVLVCMTGSMVSGILLSRYVFDWNIRGAGEIAQPVHMFCAYWGFAFMSLHLGAHWRMLLGAARKLVKKPPELPKWFLPAAAVLVAAYGACAFFKRDLGNYMLLRYHFVFFDLEEPLAWVLLDYAAVMGLFLCAGHYISKMLIRGRK